MKKFKIIFTLLIALIITCVPTAVFAEEDYDSQLYINETTGYYALIADYADFLTSSEEKTLLSSMAEITEYCNVVYLTNLDNTYESEGFCASVCKNFLENMFGINTPAVIYCVDNAYDYIYAQGPTYDVITSSKAYSITDNVYTYSTRHQFLEGATEAFYEIQRLLTGHAIAEPMKYICNAFIAVFLALIINYMIVKSRSNLRSASVAEMVSGTKNYAITDNVSVTHTGTTRTYSPKSSSSSGSSGGGGRSGGGSHGGGGGHRH